MNKAMILAAGSGKRMLPLTKQVPKALLEIQGKPLIVHHIENLAKAGVTDIVINLAHCSEQIQDRLGDGTDFGMDLHYSQEPPGGFETGGGIFNALDFFGDEAFWVVNADIYTDFPFAELPSQIHTEAHLILVSNPSFHAQGDFVLANDNQVCCPSNANQPCLTFSGIGVYRKALFTDCKLGKFPLAPLLKRAMQQNQVSGERFDGLWLNINTPDSLAAARSRLGERDVN